MIEIKNLTKKYGKTTILDQANYTFPQSGIVCLMGGSGGGKTTLFNLMAGFDTDYNGEICVGGTDIKQMKADSLCAYRRDNIGFVFQNYNLLSGYTALENVMLACELTKENPVKHLHKANDLLKKLGLSDKSQQISNTLSGGQKQRVAIARALINDPQIILADEPTGALDRKSSTEIMELFREISADRLVVVITHDAKICDFADEVIHINEQKITAEKTTKQNPNNTTQIKALKSQKAVKSSSIFRAIKNFKVHIKLYIAVSVVISVGLLAFMFSLSFGNVTEKSIGEFKEKNTAFNTGYIKGADDGTVLKYLEEDERIENAYYQYKLENMRLSTNEKTEEIAEKFPSSRATESMSYGTMPRREKKEISLSPSLAKKFDSDIKSLVGKQIIISQNTSEYVLTISGIFNAGYDDFFVSADVEQKFYENITAQENYSISYDVKNFSDIVAVDKSLKLRGITVKTAADEVHALEKTFSSLNRLFIVISGLVLIIGMFICTVLLVKLQQSRYHEVGLLAALGFNRHRISAVIRAENVFLAALATVVNTVLLAVSVILFEVFQLAFILSISQALVSVAATFAVVMLLSAAASYRLVRAEPALALRK